MSTTRPELRGSFGMVSSTHWLASQSGMAILERGGNAFDAAVAAGFVLQVVEPHMNGLGGEVPILLFDVRQPSVKVICGQGPAPKRATTSHFHALGLAMIPGTGLLPACVPGAFGGWLTLLSRHGTMRLRDVLAYAIHYATDGYPVLPAISTAIAQMEPLFREEWGESGRVYLADGVPEPGKQLRNPDLARTYSRLVEAAEKAGGDRERQIDAAMRAFYQGFVAEAVDKHCRAPVEDGFGKHQGLLSAADLAAWQPPIEAPTSFKFGDATVHKTGPWGQGPVFLQQLALLDGVDLKAMGLLSADHIHRVVEGAKLAFADREAWYGDPDFADVPLAKLLDKRYAAERRKLIGERASFELRPGLAGSLPALSADSLPPVGRDGEEVQSRFKMKADPVGDTCHVDVVDRFGNMVSATPSGGWLQSSPVIAGFGFCLGTRGQMFNLVEGHPDALLPGKRPRTTLSPSLVTREDKPWLAFGTPGGDQQDQWTFNFFLAHAIFGLNLQEAVDAPMFHTTHFPSSFFPHAAAPGHMLAENRIDPKVAAELRSRGHELELVEDWSLGKTCVVAIDPETGQLKAAANPRGMQCYATGR